MQQQNHCLPGGFNPFIPVLVLLFPLLPNRDERLSRPGSSAPDTTECSGDFAPGKRMMGKFFTPWKRRL